MARLEKVGNMCGRIDLSDPAAVQNALVNRRFRQRQINFGEPRPNVPPSWKVPLLWRENGEDCADLVTWQIHCRVGPKVLPIANARRNKLFSFTPYRDGVLMRPAVLVLNGFYEWPADKIDKRPRHITPTSGGVFFFAGFWQPDTANGDMACCLITVEPCPSIASFHNRMPALLEESQVDDWLGSKTRKDVERLVSTASDERIQIAIGDTSMNKVPRA